MVLWGTLVLKTLQNYSYYLNLDVTEPVFGVSDQVRQNRAVQLQW